MPTASRRPASRPSRAQRRFTGTRTATRTYTVPEAAPLSPTSAVGRRFYSAEPAPTDYRREFFFVRHDLIRIVLIAAVLIAGIIALSFVL